MSMKGKLGLLAMTAALIGGGFGMDGMGNERNATRPEDIDTTPKEPIIPKGCKKYVFKESFGTLEVIAMNEKSAMKKYNKWCAANSQGVV